MSEPLDTRLPEPGALYVIVRGRRAPIFSPFLESYHGAWLEQRGDRGSVLRVLSAAAWPLVLCRMEWDAGYDGAVPQAPQERPPLPEGMFGMYMREIGVSAQERHRQAQAARSQVARPRQLYDFTEVLVRRVSEDFLTMCKSGETPQGPHDGTDLRTRCD